MDEHFTPPIPAREDKDAIEVMAKDLYDLGNHCIEEKNHQEALQYLQKALAVRLQSLPENYYELALCYRKIGDVKRCLGEYKTAMDYYEKTLHFLSLTFSSEADQQLGLMYSVIGDVKVELEEYEKAAYCYDSVITILLQKPEGLFTYIAEAAYKLGRVLLNKLNRPLEAKFYIENSIVWFERVYGADHEKILRSKKLLDCCCSALDNGSPV